MFHQNSILSIIGQHGGGSPDSILTRKANDISQSGITFWAYRSHLCHPSMVHLMSKNSEEIWCYFIEPSTKNSARPTTEDVQATQYSVDKNIWSTFPPNIGPVSGCVNFGCFAMVFDVIELGSQEIDTWGYRCFHNHAPVKFSLGCSTVCVEPTSDVQNGMKSRFRKSVAKARLKSPYAVFLR